MFAIIRYDGNYTELYTARDIAHQWVKDFQTKQTKTDIFNLKKKTGGEFELNFGGFITMSPYL